ncbi:hypothetical protein BGZ73_007974 [Actinomortierella ambigua]|nr:hypothetical protein BGZ73_007974 [Actinomortierella ambigua]
MGSMEKPDWLKAKENPKREELPYGEDEVHYTDIAGREHYSVDKDAEQDLDEKMSIYSNDSFKSTRTTLSFRTFRSKLSTAALPIPPTLQQPTVAPVDTQVTHAGAAAALTTTTFDPKGKGKRVSYHSEKSLSSDTHSMTRSTFSLYGYGYNDDDDDEMKLFEYESQHKPMPTPFYRRRRFWFRCCGATAVLVAIFVPLFLFVFLPMIAQQMINSSDMVVRQLNLTTLAETSAQASVRAAMQGIPTFISAQVDFLEDVKVFWSAPGQDPEATKPIGSMKLGTVVMPRGAKGGAVIEQQTVFNILDPDNFSLFAKEMMSVESFQWTMTTRIDLHVLGRHIKDLKMNKAIKMNGLNSFSNMKLVSFDMPGEAPDRSGTLVKIVATIDNVSPMGLTLNNLTLDMGLKTAHLGRIHAQTFQMVGGQTSTIVLEGTIVRQTDPVHLQELSDMISNFLANKPTPAQGQGVSVLTSEGTAISWLTAAITSTKIILPIVLPTPFKLIDKVVLKDMQLQMNEAAPWSPLVTSSEIATHFSLPFEIGLNITEVVDPVITLSYGGVALTEIRTAVWNRTATSMVDRRIVFTLPSTSIAIVESGRTAFEDFMIAVVQQPQVVMGFSGSARASANTTLGYVTLTVPIEANVDLTGVNFGQLRPKMGKIDVTGGTPDYLTLTATVMLDNPSIFTVEAGSCKLYMSGTVNGMTDYLGEVMIQNLKLVPGPNALVAEVRMHPTNNQFRNAFFSEYIKGTVFAATIEGREDSSTIVSLRRPPPKLIVGGEGSPSVWSMLGDRRFSMRCLVMNPLNVELWMHQLKATASYKGEYFGSLDVQQSFAIRANTTDYSPYLTLQAPAGFKFLTFMATTFLVENPQVLTGGVVKIDIQAQILASIGGTMGVGYAAEMTYAQTIEAFIKLDLGGLKIGNGPAPTSPFSPKPSSAAAGAIAMSLDLAPAVMARSHQPRRLTEGEGSDIDLRYVLASAMVGPAPPLNADSGKTYIQWLQNLIEKAHPEESTL